MLNFLEEPALAWLFRQVIIVLGELRLKKGPEPQSIYSNSTDKVTSDTDRFKCFEENTSVLYLLSPLSVQAFPFKLNVCMDKMW